MYNPINNSTLTITHYFMYLTNFIYNHFMFRTDSAISIILSSLNFLSVLLPPEDDRVNSQNM